MSDTSQYGPLVQAESLKKHLNQVIQFNNKMAAKGAHKRKMVPCIWGPPGIGKTSIVKQLLDPNTIIIDIPLAQFEEMGDIHGMPLKTVDDQGSPITMYAPPNWVPKEDKDKNFIILFDDWNRADIRIIKGAMQLLQNYGTISWKFPPRTTIVLTGNMDDGEQLVVSVDSAINTRIRHFQLEPDHLAWAEWARKEEEVDERVISFILRHKEHFCPKIPNGKTNPRTLTEFGEFLKNSSSLSPLDIKIHARAALDDQTAIMFEKFINEELKELINPVDILKGDWSEDAMNKLASEGKTDVIYTIVDRLYVEVCNTRKTDSKHENFGKFLTIKAIPKEMTMSILQRLTNVDNKNEWCKGPYLSKLAVQVYSQSF